jgi:hypothetical protein
MKYNYIYSISCTLLFFCNSCSKSDQSVDPPILTPVLPTAYYVSISGNDSNNGTREKPFRTVDKVNSLDLQPGETVFFEGGSSFQGTLLLDSADNGSKDKPVIITSYGNGTSTIDGNTKEAVIIKSDYFELKNINAHGAGRKEGNTTSGIHIENAKHGLVEQIITEGFQKSGLQLISSENVVINKITAQNNGFSGIYVTGDFERNGRILQPGERTSNRIIIRECIAESNPGDPSNLTNHSGNGIFVESTDNVLIEYCVATNNGWDMPHSGTGPIGIWTSSCDSVTIQHCISYDNKTRGWDGGGFGIDGGVTNSVIQYCLSYDNIGAGYGVYHWDGASNWRNNTIRYSISINDARNSHYGSISFWNGSRDSKQFTNCQIYNNVVYNQYSSNVVFIENCQTAKFIFSNNIFIGNNDIVKGTVSDDKFLGNTYWQTAGSTINFRGYKTLQEWANATGQELYDGQLKGKYMDPLLIGPFTTTLSDPKQLKSLTGFKLHTNSPIKDGGVYLGTLFKVELPSHDFFGNAVIKNFIPEPGIHALN